MGKKLVTSTNKRAILEASRKKMKKRKQPKASEGMIKRKDLTEAQRLALRESAQRRNIYVQRSKVGREKIFSEPAKMWEAAVEYFEFCDSTPWYEHDFKNTRSGLVEVKKPKGRPYTMGTLALFFDVWEDYFYNFKRNLKSTDPTTPEFERVIARIESTVRHQKFEGAANNAFNANLISYDLGIRKDNPNTTGQGFQIIVQNEQDSELLHEVRARLMEIDKQEN
jgi:hypothetical protein